MPATRLIDPPLLRGRTLLALGILYCLFHLAFRLAISPVIAVDDAEQIVAAQRLTLGYRLYQPPLYTWVLWAVTRLTGPGLLAISIVKYGLLLATLIAFHAAARRLSGRRDVAALATLSLSLIYVVGHQVHRGFTHTMMLMLVCTATVHLAALLRDRRDAWLYAALGVAIGLGCLSKYSYAGFLAALVGACLTVPQWRGAVLNRGTLLAAVVALAITLPYGWWVVTETVGFAEHAAQRLAAPDEYGVLGARLQGLVLLLEAVLVEFMPPFLYVALLCFPVLLRRRPWRLVHADPAGRLMINHAAISLAILTLLVVASGTELFKGRHLHPFLMYTPIPLFMALAAAQAEGLVRPDRLRRGMRAYLAVTAVAAAAVAIGIAIVALRNPPDCNRCRLQKPYPALAAHLAAEGLDRGTLIAGDSFLAANLHAALPALRAYTSQYPDLPPAAADRPAAACIIAWDASEDPALPADLAAFAAAVRGETRPPDADAAGTVTVPYGRATGLTYAFRIMVLPPAGDCR